MGRELMKKKIIQSTLILIILSVIAKGLSFFVRIYLARMMSEDAMSIYSLASPTLVFLITIAQMGIPSALAKVIAQSKTSLPALMSSVILSVANNLIVMGLFMFAIPLLSRVILKQSHIESILMAMLPMIPLVTLSGLLKGYLQGKQEHVSACASQIFEEVFRIIYLLIALANTESLTPVRMAEIAMFSICVGECGSSLYMFLFCMFNKGGMKSFSQPLKYVNKATINEILSISIPMTSSRLIGSLTYFFEPILLVSRVTDPSFLIRAYGQLNGYVLPIITMPSFITVTLASTLLPAFTFENSRGNNARARKIFLVIFSVCLMIGCSTSLIVYFFTEECLMLFYHSLSGLDFLKRLALPFALYSLQPVLSSMLHALNKSKLALMDTMLGSVLRLLMITFLTPILNEQALILALTSSMLLTTLLHGWHVAYAMLKRAS